MVRREGLTGSLISKLYTVFDSEGALLSLGEEAASAARVVNPRYTVILHHNVDLA